MRSSGCACLEYSGAPAAQLPARTCPKGSIAGSCGWYRTASRWPISFLALPLCGPLQVATAAEAETYSPRLAEGVKVRAPADT